MAGEPIAAAAADGKLSESSASGDFVIHHWRTGVPASRDRSLRPFLPASRPRALDVSGGSASFPNGRGVWDRLARRLQWEEDGGAPVGGYTSLRDLIDSPPTTSAGAAAASGERSPATSWGGAGGGWEIRIRNHLVKQAAYAYLQPTPSASESDRRHRRLTLRRALSLLTCGLAVDPIDLCVAFLRRLFRRPP